MMEQVTNELTDSERHLLNELRLTNEALERELLERTAAMSATNSKLEAEIREMSRIIAELRTA
jgi:C4-dicarboxylate-specific signal transduction histidine kinase